jgi:hypothetical protein
MVETQCMVNGKTFKLKYRRQLKKKYPKELFYQNQLFDFV